MPAGKKHKIKNARPWMQSALLLAVVSAFSLPAPVLAYNDYEVDTSDIGRDTQGVVTSGQIFELGVINASGLRLEGENYLKQGALDQAIKVLQRAVEMAPNDTDNRLYYAQALERKLLRQPRQSRDPGLYNFVIKQWLCVAKAGEFGDQMMEGYNHLYKLTGTMPKKREKEKNFLKRVLIPEDGSVPVVIGGKPPAAAANGKKQTASRSANQD